MKRLAAFLLLAAITAGCGVRETREKVVEREGVKFLCSYTHNNISGNESEQQCAPVPGGGR